MRQGCGAKLKSGRPDREPNHPHGDELFERYPPNVVSGYPVELLNLIWQVQQY